MESGFQSSRPGGAEFINGCRDEGLAIHRDFETPAAGGTDAGCKELELAGDSFDFGHMLVRRADEHRRRGLGEQAEKRMTGQPLLLRDGYTDVLGERRLGRGHRDATIGNVARGANKLAVGKGFQ